MWCIRTLCPPRQSMHEPLERGAHLGPRTHGLDKTPGTQSWSPGPQDPTSSTSTVAPGVPAHSGLWQRCGVRARLADERSELVTSWLVSEQLHESELHTLSPQSPALFVVISIKCASCTRLELLLGAACCGTGAVCSRSAGSLGTALIREAGRIIPHRSALQVVAGSPQRVPVAKFLHTLPCAAAFFYRRAGWVAPSRSAPSPRESHNLKRTTFTRLTQSGFQSKRRQ